MPCEVFCTMGTISPLQKGLEQCLVLFFFFFFFYWKGARGLTVRPLRFLIKKDDSISRRPN